MTRNGLFAAYVAASMGLCAPALAGVSAAAGAVDIANPPERLDSIAARKCDKRTKSGLGYQMLRAGQGDTPDEDARVKVGYAGYFLSDGSRFDNGAEAQFPVKGVIAGFGEGVMLMNRGAQYRLCIPSRLGYGDKDRGPIPADSNLIFLVEMIDF